MNIRVFEFFSKQQQQQQEEEEEEEGFEQRLCLDLPF